MPNLEPLEHRRKLYTGAGQALARSMELAAMPVLAALAGQWVDHRLGTEPAATLILVVLAVAGEAARSYYDYIAAVHAGHDEDTT